MILTMIPQWGRPESTLSIAGDVLTRDGTVFDLSSVPEGGEGHVTPAPGEDHFFLGPITREGGVIHATIIVHLGADASLDQPEAPWTVTVFSGSVTIPATRIEEAAQ
jgi:hypothetical protein